MNTGLRNGENNMTQPVFEDSFLRKSVHFEWVVEYVDCYDDIHDHERADNLLKEKQVGDIVKAIASGDDKQGDLTLRLALVRDYGSEAESLISRSYAYTFFDKGKLTLPKETEEGQKVPERLIKQLERLQGETND